MPIVRSGEDPEEIELRQIEAAVEAIEEAGDKATEAARKLQITKDAADADSVDA
jgi:hypothetical protein